MKSIDYVINVTYNIIVSPIKLGVWAWKKVRPSKAAVVYNDSCPLFSEIPMVSDTSKIDALCPSAHPPVEAKSVYDLFAGNGELIHKLCDASTLSEEEAERFLLPVIKNLAMIVHLAPDSEYDHHQGYGGLFTHSLEVALYVANEANITIFDDSASLREQHKNERFWILTAILAALCHDIGKVFTDMTITAPDGQCWPQNEPLLLWLRKNKIEKYFISFNPERDPNDYKSASIAKNAMLIPTDTFKFIAESGCGVVMESALWQAVLYGKNGGLIGGMLDNANDMSRSADQLRQRQS